MKKKITVTPLKGETKSQSLYRTAEEAFNDFQNFDTYVNKEYGGWIFEFGYEKPQDVETLDTLVFHFDVYYKYDGYTRQVAHQKTYTIKSENDKEKDERILQGMADDISDDIEAFWDSKDKYKPMRPENDNQELI